jgi:hypothetical protein
MRVGSGGGNPRAAVAGAAGAAGRSGCGRGSFFTYAHKTETAGYNAPDRFTRVRMAPQGGVPHALHELEAPRVFAGTLRDGFIYVSRHAEHHGGTQIWAFSKARTWLILRHA